MGDNPEASSTEARENWLQRELAKARQREIEEERTLALLLQKGIKVSKRQFVWSSRTNRVVGYWDSSNIYRKLEFPELQLVDDTSDEEPSVSVAQGDDAERRALAKLELAKKLIGHGQRTTAVTWLRRLLDEFPQTIAAIEATRLLETLR